MALPNPVVDDPAVASPALPAVSGAAVPVTFHFEPFNPASSKFDRWLNRLQISFRIYHVREADKRDFLLHYMGGPTYDVLCNKLKNAEPHTKTYDEIVALLKEHYSPTPLNCKQETLSDVVFHLHYDTSTKTAIGIHTHTLTNDRIPSCHFVFIFLQHGCQIVRDKPTCITNPLCSRV